MYSLLILFMRKGYNEAAQNKLYWTAENRPDRHEIKAELYLFTCHTSFHRVLLVI
jgi:hypothetical protein